MIDTSFTTALQIVINVAVNEEQGIRSTSKSLASGLATNPSFVRRLIAPLNENGILISSAGNNGGIRLAKAPSAIPLSEIYEAVVANKKIWAVRHDIPHQCFISNNIAELTQHLCEKAEAAVILTLSQETVEESIRELQRLNSHSKDTSPASVS